MKINRKLITKPAAIVLSLVLLLCGIIVGSYAYLNIKTPKVQNTFDVAEAPEPTVNEDFDKGDTVKKDVYVSLSKKDGEAGSYFVRAAIVMSFQDDSDNTVMGTPLVGTDYTITLGSDWTKIGDYYYYTKPVVAGGNTTNLINSCATLNSEYHLVVDVLAQTIQANPIDAVQQNWGVTIADGAVSKFSGAGSN